MISGAGPSVPAAACTTLRPLLEGPARGALVLGAWPAAAYLLLDTPVPGAPRVVGLCLADAVHLPLSLVLAPHPGVAPWVGTSGWRATVGCGEVRVHAPTSGTPPPTAGRAVHAVRAVRAVRAARFWTPAQAWPTAPVRPDALAAAVGVVTGLSATAKPPPAVCAGTRHLMAALGSDDLPAACAAADSLLGLGPGLTPAGDDALAGVLLMAHRLVPAGSGRSVLVGLAGHLTRTAHRRTTALSADLLVLAGEGLAAAPAVALVDALAGAVGSPAADGVRLRSATLALLRVGHTSGADTTYGILAAARAWTAARTCETDIPRREKEPV